MSRFVKQCMCGLLALGLLAAGSGQAQAEPTPVYGGTSISNQPMGENLCAITFDDGPSIFTPHLLDMLDYYGISATFFQLGKNAAYYPDIVKRVLAEGHEVGSHSYSHPNMRKLSYQAKEEQLAKTDKILRYLKYVMLFVMVFALPFFYRGSYGEGTPFFCKYVCPVGTLEGGIPLVLLNDTMRSTLGWLFRWKFLLMIICILSSVFIYRPFCKYICPLGAFYGLFQKGSFIRMHLDEHACVDCGLCAKTCKMNVDPHKNPNSCECIRCRESISVCPKHALSMGIREKALRVSKSEQK